MVFIACRPAGHDVLHEFGEFASAGPAFPSGIPGFPQQLSQAPQQYAMPHSATMPSFSAHPQFPNQLVGGFPQNNMQNMYNVQHSQSMTFQQLQRPQASQQIRPVGSINAGLGMNVAPSSVPMGYQFNSGPGATGQVKHFPCFLYLSVSNLVE